MDCSRPAFEERRELTSPTKRPIGVLAWSAKERAECARTGWPERVREAPDKKPPGLSISSIPDLSVQSPEEPFEGTFFDASVILLANALNRPKPGPKKAEKDILLIRECRRKTGGDEKEARKEFAKRVAGRKGDKASYPVASKRFTKGMKHIRELECARGKSLASLLTILDNRGQK